MKDIFTLPEGFKGKTNTYDESNRIILSIDEINNRKEKYSYNKEGDITYAEYSNGTKFIYAYIYHPNGKVKKKISETFINGVSVTKKVENFDERGVLIEKI